MGQHVLSAKRTLTLKREALTELTEDDLRGVAAGVRALSDQWGRCTFDNSYIFCTASC